MAEELYRVEPIKMHDLVALVAGTIAVERTCVCKSNIGAKAEFQ